MKQLNVALLGLGTVGSGVVKIIEENHQQIKETIQKIFRLSIFWFEINPKATAKYFTLSFDGRCE